MASYGRVNPSVGIPDGTGNIPGGFAVAPGSAGQWGQGPIPSADPTSWALGNGTQTQLQQNLADGPSATHVMQWRPKGDQLRIIMTGEIVKQLGDFSRILVLRPWNNDVAFTWEIKVVPQSTMSSIAPFGNAPYVTQHKQRRSVVLQMWGKQALVESAVHAHTGEGMDMIDDAGLQLRNDAAATLVLQGFDAVLRSESHAGVYTTTHGRNRTQNAIRQDQNEAVWNFACAHKQEGAVDMMVTAAGRNLSVYGSTPRALVACFGIHQYLALTEKATTYSESGPDKTRNGFLSLLNARTTVSGLSLHESTNMNIGGAETRDPMTRDVPIGEHAAVGLSEGFHTVRLIDDSKGRGGDVTVDDALAATHLFDDVTGQLNIALVQRWLDSMPPAAREKAVRFTPLVGRVAVGSSVQVHAVAFLGQIDDQFVTESRVAATTSSFEAALAAISGSFAEDAKAVKGFINLFGNASYDANVHAANKAWAATIRSTHKTELRNTNGMPDLNLGIEWISFRHAGDGGIGDLSNAANAWAGGSEAAEAARRINASRLRNNFFAGGRAGGNFAPYGGAEIGDAVNTHANEYDNRKADMKRVGEAPGGYCTLPGLRFLAAQTEADAVFHVYKPAVLAARKALPAFEAIARALKSVMPNSVLYQAVPNSPFTQEGCGQEDAALQTLFHVIAGSQSPIFITLNDTSDAGAARRHGEPAVSRAHLLGLGVQRHAAGQSTALRTKERNDAVKGLLGLSGAEYRAARDSLTNIGGDTATAMRIALGRAYAETSAAAGGNPAAQRTLDTMRGMLRELLTAINNAHASASHATSDEVNTAVAAFNIFLSSVGGAGNFTNAAPGANIPAGVSSAYAGPVAAIRDLTLGDIGVARVSHVAASALIVQADGTATGTTVPPAGQCIIQARIANHATVGCNQYIALPSAVPGLPARGGTDRLIVVATPLAMPKPSAGWAAAALADATRGGGAVTLENLQRRVVFCAYDPTSLPGLRSAFEALNDGRGGAAAPDRYVRKHGRRLAMGHHLGGDGGFVHSSHLLPADELRRMAVGGYAELTQQARGVNAGRVGFAFGPQAYLPKRVLARIFNGEPNFGALAFFANIDRATIASMAYAGVRLPFDLAVIRPFMTYTMGSAVVTDYKVGYMLYSFVNMAMGEDVTNKATTMNLTMKSACAVVRPTALQLLPYVLCLGYVRGGSLIPFKHSKRSLPFAGNAEGARRARAEEMTNRDASYYGAFVPPGALDDEHDWAEASGLFQYMFALRRGQNLVSSTQAYPRRAGDSSVCYPAGIQECFGTGDRFLRKSPSRTPFGDFKSFKACSMAHQGRWGHKMSALDAPDTSTRN